MKNLGYIPSRAVTASASRESQKRVLLLHPNSVISFMACGGVDIQHIPPRLYQMNRGRQSGWVDAVHVAQRVCIHKGLAHVRT